jgi:hypothetical protein
MYSSQNQKRKDFVGVSGIEVGAGRESIEKNMKTRNQFN